MGEPKRYIVTVPSCSCDAESAYVYLTDDEKALLERIRIALDPPWGAGLYVGEVEDASDYEIDRAETNARRAAVSGPGDGQG